MPVGRLVAAVTDACAREKEREDCCFGFSFFFFFFFFSPEEGYCYTDQWRRFFGGVAVELNNNCPSTLRTMKLPLR